MGDIEASKNERMVWVGMDLEHHSGPPCQGSDTFHLTRFLKYVSELTVPVELDLTCRICFPSVQVPEHSVGIFPHQSLDR